jgi:hypothetical protein
MGSLCPREDHWDWDRGRRISKPHLHPLVAQQLHAGPSMRSAWPVLPEQGVGAELAGVKQDTYSARMPGGLPMPLALFPQPTGATVGDAGLIHQAQATLGLLSLFATPQTLASGAAQTPVRLEGSRPSPRSAPFSRVQRPRPGHNPAQAVSPFHHWAGHSQTRWCAQAP